ncbi:hypothetical protein H7H69_22740 [Mycobacterium heckeshornense]|nr:hypothetical protein [Mycobacterium heckeshornense]
MTEYLTPSGPTTSPLAGLYVAVIPGGRVYTHGLGCCPLHVTLPWPGRLSGSLTGEAGAGS